MVVSESGDKTMDEAGGLAPVPKQMPDEPQETLRHAGTEPGRVSYPTFSSR